MRLLWDLHFPVLCRQSLPWYKTGMKTFGFTQKKFLSLTEQGRQKHLITWLSGIYQAISTGRVPPDRLALFYAEYRGITAWMDSPCPAIPTSESARGWLVFVSDLIQVYRTASGNSLRDHDLLEKIATHDRPMPEIPHPDMDYQVALDGLRSLFNVGSVFRTCEAAGIGTIILGNCLGKEDPRVRKTAMGSHDHIAQEHTTDLADTLAGRKEQGFRIIGVETVDDSIPCHHYAWPSKAVVVMGNEEYGISPHVLGTADDIVHIPMFGRKNSMNVANALSAVLYQAVFHRMGNPGESEKNMPTPGDST